MGVILNKPKPKLKVFKASMKKPIIEQKTEEPPRTCF